MPKKPRVFSVDLKLQIVKRMLAGESARDLAPKRDIPMECAPKTGHPAVVIGLGEQAAAVQSSSP